MFRDPQYYDCAKDAATPVPDSRAVRDANGALQATGISFPSTYVGISDANTLDDYEEGTFTPVVAGMTTAGTGTYTTQTGIYTKIGRVVYYSLALTWTAHTGTGYTSVTGLPFSADATLNYRSGTCSLSLFTFTGSPFLYVAANNSYAIVLNQASGVAPSNVTIVSAGTISVSGFYFTT